MLKVVYRGKNKHTTVCHSVKLKLNNPNLILLIEESPEMTQILLGNKSSIEMNTVLIFITKKGEKNKNETL